MDISAVIKNDLLTYIKRRLAPQPVKIRADIEVTCFTYEGIDAIKAALGEGEDKSKLQFIFFYLCVLLWKVFFFLVVFLLSTFIQYCLILLIIM